MTLRVARRFVFRWLSRFPMSTWPAGLSVCLMLALFSCKDSTGPSAPSQLVITTQPSATAQSGVVFAQQPAIQLHDASANPVSQSGVQVTAELATGSPTLDGTLTATTNASGLAIFTDLKITGVLGDRTLRFTSGTLTAATSDVIDVTVPTPQLAFVGTEDDTVLGDPFTRYWLTVTNRSVYPQELFDPAPDLPPCGLNQNASRAWVNIYDGQGQRLITFCGLSSPEDLNGIWFGVWQGDSPPASVYIDLNDRRRDKTYTSNVINVPPPSVVAFLGNNQHGLVGYAVNIRPAVRVTDAGSAAVSGRSVTFTVASGGGSVTSATVNTNSNGVAQVGSWVLGGSPGTNTLTATVTGSGIVGNPVTFTAAGQAGGIQRRDPERRPPFSAAVQMAFDHPSNRRRAVARQSPC